MIELDIGEHIINNHKFFVGRGFGYKRDDNGIPSWRIHNFKVKIGEGIFIGNGTNIDIGRDRDTEIRDYSVIDSLVHVGHSVIIGKKCIIVSGTVIGGHAEIGDGCHIGMNVSIKQGVKIDKGCFIGSHSFVNRDIPENSLAFGAPARIVEYCKNMDYVLRSVYRAK